jgi:hypothetical protein
VTTIGFRREQRLVDLTEAALSATFAITKPLSRGQLGAALSS